MRRDVAAELEHELVTVAQPQAARIASAQDAVAIQPHVAAEAHEPRRAERLRPDREEIRERRSRFERDDAGRIGRPRARMTARCDDAAEAKPRFAQANRGGDDHNAAVREQLDMHARRAVQRTGDAEPVRGGRRVVARPDADRRRHERKRNGHRKHLLQTIPFVVLVAVVAGCGGGSGTKSFTVGAARTFSLEAVKATAAAAGKPTQLSYKILQPDGSTLTAFKRGPGPHTGVHLIFVRSDLSTIVHRHPAIAADGTFSDTIVFPSGGFYRLVVDVYPATGPQTNFQLFSMLAVKGKVVTRPPPPSGGTETVDGYRFTLEGHQKLRAIQAAFLHFTVTGPDGKPASFTPWYGALAHAIFFRSGSLDYFHTHVCAPGAFGCTSLLGATRVTGTSSTPGKLTVGVLVPLAGDWRLFLQCQVNGHVVTAPFTLHVS